MTNRSGHSSGLGEQRPVLPDGSQHGLESTPGQLSGKRGTVGSRTPEPGVHPGKPTPGGESRDPMHCNQNSATHTTASAGGTTHMEKPHLPDQHRHLIGLLATSIGKPAALNPRPDVPTTETPGGTHNARDETATGATQTPSIPKPTSTQARGRKRRSSPLNTTWIIRETFLGSAVRTTPTAFPAPPLSLTT